jgi:hypothetical protein
MPSTYFDLLGLAAELRAMVYDFYFTSDSTNDLGHVIHSKPENNLLATSRFNYNEATPSYIDARQQHRSRRAQIWQDVTHELERLAANMRGAVGSGFMLPDHMDCKVLTAADVAGHINRRTAVACSSPQSHNHGLTPWGCGSTLLPR